MGSDWTKEEEIKKAVEEFKKTIVKEPFKKYKIDSKSTDLSDNIENQILFCADALYQGYLDACRTFQKQEKISKLNVKSENIIDKDNKLWSIAANIQEYLVKGKTECFPDKHKEWCQRFMDEYKGMKYGQAQKIVNMSFKYIYCFFYGKKQFKDYLEKLNECHMPFDRFSLEWLKRYSNARDKKFKIKAEAWSKMEPDEYQTYCNQINKLLEATNITPLQLDFYIWPKIQMILSAEAFIKTFKGETEGKISNSDNEEINGYELDTLDKTLRNKLKKVQIIVNSVTGD